MAFMGREVIGLLENKERVGPLYSTTIEGIFMGQRLAGQEFVLENLGPVFGPTSL